MGRGVQKLGVDTVVQVGAWTDDCLAGFKDFCLDLSGIKDVFVEIGLIIKNKYSYLLYT